MDVCQWYVKSESPNPAGTWQELPIVPGPGKRHAGTTAAYNGDMFIFGGIDSNGVYLNEVWKLG